MVVRLCPSCSGSGSRWLAPLRLTAVLILAACTTLGVPSHEARAQSRPLQITPIAPAAQARAGVYLLQNGQPEAALSLLRKALAADSTLYLSEHGAVAYWLGEAYARTDDSAAAQRTWRTGLHRLTHAGGFDVRLADAALRHLTPSRLRGHRLYAVDHYRRLLARVGPDTTDAVQAILRRRVAQIAPLLPDNVFAEVVHQSREAEPDAWSFRPEAGAALQAWWRGLDPFPKTPENERLEEHLTRLVRAEEHFRCPDTPSSLDARGEAHLRFGAPFKRHVLSYQDAEFFREVVRFGVPIPASGFPEGEIWTYPHIDDAAYYLFVEEDGTGCFQVARANDLLPSTLRFARGTSERGLNIAYSSLMALRSMYEELALYHADYAGRYQEIANYAGWQEMEATVARLGGSTGSTQQVTVGAGVGQTRVISTNPILGIAPPTEFVGQMVARAAREDATAARRRQEVLPPQYTALREGTPRLPVAVRTARTLTEDGATETKIYWGVRAEDVVLHNDSTTTPSTITVAATQSDSTHTPLARRSGRHRVGATPPDSSVGLVPSPLTLTAPAGRYHLSLQWTQYRRWTNTDGPLGDLGPKRRVAYTQLDSLRPLRATGRLEMSDVTVLSAPDTASAVPAALMGQATPYPFRTVSADTPLLLSFELYHLVPGPDGRTRYTIAYEVTGRTRRGWTRLFRGQDTQQTATETTVTGSTPRTTETILLDLSEIVRKEAQDVRVTVRVTDEETGTTATRSVDFVLTSDDAS